MLNKKPRAQNEHGIFFKAFPKGKVAFAKQMTDEG